VALLWVGFWLAIVLVSTKAASLGYPRTWHYPLELAHVSFRDVLFALALSSCGQVGVMLLSRRPRFSAIVRIVTIAACVFCALYSVIAYGVFESFDRPLSFDLLRLMRGSAVTSSITDRISLQIGLSLVVAPLAVWVAARFFSHRRAFPPIIIASMAGWIVMGSLHHFSPDTVWKAQRLVLNPHVELFRSTLIGLTGRPRASLPRDFEPEDQDELQPFGKRPIAALPGFQPGGNAQRPRNVIVVILESVATKYMSLYGSRYASTPNLLAESRHALLYDNIYAHAPYTFCTFMCVNYSIYPGLPWAYAPGPGFALEGPRRLPPTFASVLQQRGWRTAYLHNGDMDWGGQKYLLQNAGYDTVEDYHDFKAPELTSWGAEDRYLVDRLIRWIDEKPGQPFMAYCWTDQTHNPYVLRPGAQRYDFYHGKPPRAHPDSLARYLNVLHEADAQLGRLFAALRERGIADDTLVVITGDHGEAFADPHDQQGHGFSVYQEEVNVPLMLWNPRLFPEAKHATNIGGHVDLNPTLADIFDVPAPAEWQGHSLFDRARPERTFFVASVDDYILGMREGSWKYIFEATSGVESLYDLASDPNESRNVVMAEPDRARRLRQRIAAWIEFEDQFIAAPPVKSAAR
jgi:arylsulfatase A-like enzyme